ncbi:MAG: hypothetical protein ACK5Z5_08875 [Neisseriaceae bacterium]
MAKEDDSFTLVWNLLVPDNEGSQFINEKRIDLDHCNGVSLCNNISKDLLLCALFTGAYHDPNFVSTLLKNKQNFLNSILMFR